MKSLSVLLAFILISFGVHANNHFEFASKKMIKKFNKKIELKKDSFANETKIIAPKQGCVVAKGLKDLGWCSVGKLWEYNGEHGNYESITQEFFRSYYNNEGLIEHHLYLILSYWDNDYRGYKYVLQEDGARNDLVDVAFNVEYDANDKLTYYEDLVLIITEEWLEAVVENNGLFMKLYSDKSPDNPFWRITPEYAELYLDYIRNFEKENNF